MERLREGPPDIPRLRPRPAFSENHAMKVRCPRCQQKLGVPDKYAGRAIRCSACNRAFTVPKAKIATSGPGADSTLDLEGLAKLESQTTEMDSEELAEAHASATSNQAGPGGPPARTCPNCGKQTPVDDLSVEVLCSHCWQPIPALAAGDAYEMGDTKLVGYKGTAKGSVGFYDGLTSAFSYPFQALGSLFTAVLIAVGVILLPVMVMTAVAQAAEQSNVGTAAGIQKADLGGVQIILRALFAAEVLFFSAVGIHAFLDVIRASSVGNETPPGLNWNPSQWGKSIVAYGALVVYYAIMTYVVLFLASGGPPEIPLSVEAATNLLTQPGVIVGLILISFIVPMNLVGLALGSVSQGLNPGNVVKSILKTHFHYLFLVALVCVFGAMALAAFLGILEWFLPQVDKMITGSGEEGGLLNVAAGMGAWGAVIGFVFLAVYVLGRLHGLFARAYRKKLLFGER